MQQIYPWQETQWQQLMNRYQAGNLPHAMLFAGVKDLGKRQLAECFAATLLCQSNQAACGSCPSCQWLAAASHPDLFYLQPADDSKSIKIEQVRELIESLNQTPQGGKCQVVIIEPAEALNRSAANALLKNLEEPNGAVVFFLVSHQASALPATIRSRCQTLNFAIPPEHMSKIWLQEQLPDCANITQLLAVADNIPLRAMHLSEKNQLDGYMKIFGAFLGLYIEKLNPLEVAQAYAERELNEVVDCLWSITRDLIGLQINIDSKLKYSQWRENLIIISQQVPAFRLFRFLDQLTAARKWQEEKINLNLQLQWEEILLNLVQDTHSQ